MKLPATAIAVVTLLAAARPAVAQPPETSGLDQVTLGLAVTIIDENGQRVEGKVVDVTAGAVRLSRRRAIEVVPLDRIVLVEKRDGVKNGAVGGLVFGMSLGLLGGLASGAGGQFVASAVIGQGLVCMAFGIGVDAMVNSRRTLYQRTPTVKKRVMPIVGKGTGGAVVALSW